MDNKRLISVFVTLCLLLPAASIGQIVYDQPGSGDIRLIYSFWKLEDTQGETAEISQFAIPVGGFIPVRDNFEVRFAIGNAFNNYEYSNQENDLSGLGDLRIMASHSFMNDQILTSLGVNVPTGKKELDTLSEQPIIQALSRNYLSFPIRRMGEGLGLNFMVGGATIVGESRLGAAVTYQYNGEYTPYKGTGDYKPGDYISFSGSLGGTFDELGYGLNLIYTTYMTDKVNEEKIYKQAPQFNIRLNGTYEDFPYITNVGVQVLLRGNSETYDTTGTVVNDLKQYGNEVHIFGIVEYHASGNWVFAPSLEIRNIGEPENDYGASSLFGFGLGVTKEIIPSVGLDFNFKYFTGSTDDDRIDLTGLQLSTGLVAAF